MEDDTYLNKIDTGHYPAEAHGPAFITKTSERMLEAIDLGAIATINSARERRGKARIDLELREIVIYCHKFPWCCRRRLSNEQ